MRAVAPAGISTCCRWIGEGDEALLLPLESKTVSARNASRRRMSGAARHAARILLAEPVLMGNLLDEAEMFDEAARR